MTTKPAVVILPGAWHQPIHWVNVSDRLLQNGYDVQIPATASASDVAVPDAFAKDVAIAKKAIQSFTDQGRNVVVVMHSYGGAYGSEAVAEIFEDAKGQRSCGQVTHLFYIAAFLIEQGGSVSGEETTPMATDLDLESGLIHHLEPFNRFYAATATSVARKAMAQLKPQALSAFMGACKYRGWADYGIPVTYLACLRDQALVRDTDVAKFIKRAEDAGIKDWTKHEIDCDHSPWLSSEKEFNTIFDGVLEKAADSFPGPPQGPTQKL